MGPKSRFFVQKSDFCHTTPILVNDQFLALGMTDNFPPWDRFFDFPFRSYSSFRKKNLVDLSKSLPPSSLWGHRLPVTALALSARRPFGPTRFARGLEKYLKYAHSVMNAVAIMRNCEPASWVRGFFFFFYWVRWCAEVIWYCKRCSAKSEDSQEGREELVGPLVSHLSHLIIFTLGSFLWVDFSIDIQQK